MLCPSAACVFITSYSSAVSGAGFVRIASATPILSDVVQQPGEPQLPHRFGGRPRTSAILPQRFETVSQWLRVFASFASTARASAVASVRMCRSSAVTAVAAISASSSSE